MRLRLLGLLSLLWVQAVQAEGFSAMVVSANPYASRAGHAILKAGGNAVDALVAVQMVLNLVEPQSSGIGGGAFVLYHDGAKSQLRSFDGRETAPRGISSDVFMDGDAPMAFQEAVVGGASVGTPGTLRLLYQLHREHGRLPWARLLRPAAGLAEVGFIVSPRLAGQIAEGRPEHHSAARAYFFDPQGQPRRAGYRLRNPAFAKTLRLLAAEGDAPFYTGTLAEDIARTVQAAGGTLSVEDLASYRIVERTPVCVWYRKHWVCGMGPPSSGGLTVGQILLMLENADPALLSTLSPEMVHLVSEVSRLAYADRAAYMADSDYVDVPQEALLDKGYARQRFALVSSERVLEQVRPGDLGGVRSQAWDLPSTSHISILDTDGNAVSMTTTIENRFGSGVMVGGFLLNNELTDFAFRSHKDGVALANRIEPGKRPRSSMAPTIIYDRGGQVRFVLGSPGGSRIIAYVAQAVLALLDQGASIQEAVEQGHFVKRGDVLELEAGRALEALRADLEALGHQVVVRPLNSGLHGIAVTGGGLEGGVDPRREGLALGM